MRRSLFIIFSLFFSSSTLAFSNDDEKEPASVQLSSPKVSRVERASAPTRSVSFDPIIEEEIYIIISSGLLSQSHPKRGSLYQLDTPITIRFSSNEERAWVQTNIGTLYCNALNNTEHFNFTEAMKWFRKAADQGDAEAQYSIGKLYDYGLGVQQNFTKAMQWYLLAANQNHAGAQYSIGMLYDNTEGSIQNFTEAMRWYRLAAAQNHAGAQYSIGMLYEMGLGVLADRLEAMQWFQKAADQGHESAKKNIERLKGKTKTAHHFIPTINLKR